MKLPLLATFEAKASGQKSPGWIHQTTFAQIQAQLRWRFPKGALDQGWDWLKVWLPTVSSPENFECYSVVINDELHALMSLDLRGRKVRDQRYLVVDYLATNPFDRVEGQGVQVSWSLPHGGCRDSEPGIGNARSSLAGIAPRSTHCEVLRKSRHVPSAAPVIGRLRGFYV